MVRTKQRASLSTGGKVPRKALATAAARTTRGSGEATIEHLRAYSTTVFEGYTAERRFCYNVDVSGLHPVEAGFLKLLGDGVTVSTLDLRLPLDDNLEFPARSTNIDGDDDASRLALSKFRVVYTHEAKRKENRWVIQSRGDGES